MILILRKIFIIGYFKKIYFVYFLKAKYFYNIFNIEELSFKLLFNILNTYYIVFSTFCKKKILELFLNN